MEIQGQILSVLDAPKDIWQIIAEIDCTPPEAAVNLTLLEIAGRVQRRPGNVYARLD